MPDVFDYAAPDTPPTTRTSRLAIACFVLSFFTCPWAIYKMTQRHLGPTSDNLLRLCIVLGPAAIVACASLIAFVRTRRSHGRLRGKACAVCAALISGAGFLTFAGLLGLIFILAGDMD